MQKPMYFDAEKFINEVIKEMKLGKMTAPEMLELRAMIEKLLSDRIITVVIGSFGKREMQLFEKLLIDHPEADEVDALMLIAPDVPGLKEKLERHINSLYKELVYDSDEIDKAFKFKKNLLLTT